jgi:hypothetical protein
MSSPWERDDYHQFGRDRSTDDLLDRHLRRVGARDATSQDPAAHFQVAMLRDFLRLLRAALDDEHIEPGAAQRVIERVIYGGVPQPAVTEQMIAQRTRFAEALSVDTRPMRIWAPGTQPEPET